MGGSAGNVKEPGQNLLADAQRGDESAFEALVRPYRNELHAHCYRMLGSVHDAEDVMQEVLLRAWRGLARFEGRSSLRSWLYRIATNACLNAVRSGSRRILPVGPMSAPGEEPRGMEGVQSPPVGESVWIEPYPDTMVAMTQDVSGPEARYEQRESLELAFVAALQYLPANQRAALILRDVLGFSARDAADALATTTAAVNSALQHARSNVEARVPDKSQQTTLRALGDDRLRELVERYMAALEAADVEAMLVMLTEDATWCMPPLSQWYQGHPAIADFLRAGPLTVQWRHVPTRANGQAAVGCYVWDDASGSYVGHVLDVLTLEGERIAAVTAFIDRDVFARFGLPTELPALSA
jgi:RNA polymerase sigma-70 factor, ECF subfamily